MISFSGHFAYVTGVVDGPSYAYLASETHEATDAACLRWYYHMAGPTVGSLRVYIQGADQRLDNIDANNMLFQDFGNKGDYWIAFALDIKFSTSWRYV